MVTASILLGGTVRRVSVSKLLSLSALLIPSIAHAQYLLRGRVVDSPVVAWPEWRSWCGRLAAGP